MPKPSPCELKFKIKEPDSALSEADHYDGQRYDTMLHAWMSRFTCWLSPASLSLSLFDWLLHLAISPAKQATLIKKAGENAVLLSLQTAASMGLAAYPAEKIDSTSTERDRRFRSDDWQLYPFQWYAHHFLVCEEWWQSATSHVKGVSNHHADVVNFTARQMLDMWSPTNFPFTNPEVIRATVTEGGANFVAGFKNFLEDTYRIFYHLPPAGAEKFVVGENVAVTPGKVVYRNRLIELIQYTPTTQEVYAEPVLIVPAWIMKYYILDLSPHNSLVRYLVEQGHTVFMISWKNPTSEDRHLGLEDYVNLGIMSALQVIQSILPDRQVHATGYCLGGTLLAMAAAAMAELEDHRLKTVTLFAAQVDFREPGQLSFFIDQSQISYLDDIMWEKGYLDGAQMSWAFSMLRSNDLIWSRMVHDYLLGKRRPLIDLIAWDHDTTRLPYKMHSQYLHSFFLNNDLVSGHYSVNKKRIALIDIKQPIFAVATLKDHVSPWKSVYKIKLYTNTEVTFVLTSGGHNAGIVNEPSRADKHSYQINTRHPSDKYMSPDAWAEKMSKQTGSWWPAWQTWLVKHSGEKTAPPPMGDPNQSPAVLGDAPGTYVLEK